MPDEIQPVARVHDPNSFRGRRLRMMRPDEVEAVLGLAVERALWPLLPSESAVWLADMKRRVQIEFWNLVRERARTLRGLTRSEVMADLERSRDRTLAARDEALAQLRALQARAEAAQGALSGEALERYERRIAKLNEALERTEAALAGATRGESGHASSYREVQGLDPDAKDRELRLALLGEIYEANRRLQRS